MKELALHILDIAENSVAAQAQSIEISVAENLAADRLELRVEDDGKGMDADTAARAVDPFHTSRTTRKVGLGLPLLKAAAQACEGDLALVSRLGEGTCVLVDFQRSHIDRVPLGDLPGTFLGLLVGHPEIHWKFVYTVKPATEFPLEAFEFDDGPVKEMLGDLPLTEPSILAYLRNQLEEGIAGVAASADRTRIEN
jgi:anti-sigma regulatory factor (Ser/Thr protein kinase)